MELPAFLTGLRTSFRFQLIAIFTALTALITILLTFLYVYSEIRQYRQSYSDKAHTLASHLAESIRLPLFAGNREALGQLAEDTARYPEIHAVTITSREGQLLTNLHKPAPVPPEKLFSEIIEVRSNPLGPSPESAITGEMAPDGALIGWVRLDLDTSSLAQMIRRVIVTSCGVAFLFWIMVTALCSLVFRRVTRSFNALIQGLETMRGGNFAVRIEVDRDDEPGHAAAAVNELAAALQERDKEIQRLHENLVDALRLEVQAEKKHWMAKLIQTNRMTSLGLLASSMAHEINNPNASIRLAGQYLTRTWKDALPLLQQVSAEEGDFTLGGIPFSTSRDTIVESCATIDRNTDRITRVIQDLRSYSLGERNQFRPDVDINQVVTGALTIIRSHGKHTDTSIVADPGPGIPAITGSLHQLEQVLVNLLMNAIQSLPQGKGEVKVSTSLDPATEEVLVTVRDQGEGIPPEHLEHLLEPFFSTRIEKGGSGLGLFVASFIVSEHNGRLDFVSTTGSGTTVTVRLPIRQPSINT